MYTAIFSLNKFEFTVHFYSNQAIKIYHKAEGVKYFTPSAL